jgi:hypothetical protein
VNIYVGNLSYQMTDEDLRAEFAKSGNVSKANIIKDILTGKSRGSVFLKCQIGLRLNWQSKNRRVLLSMAEF